MTRTEQTRTKQTRRQQTRTRTAAAAGLLAVLTILAGCGDTGEEASEPVSDATEADVNEAAAEESDTESDATGPNEATDAEYPMVIESFAGTFTLEQRPERIVSLSPASTEILFAVGAGDQVAAVDSFSTYPSDAPVTDLSAFEPNIEAITSYDPDLVVIAYDANDLVAGLTELDIPVYLDEAPNDIEAGYANMADLGRITGNVDATAEAVAQLRSDMEEALSQAPETSVRVYHELDENFFSASSNGFVGSVYAELGLENVADEADTDGTGFPQLTEEYIIDADPELIVITDQVAYGPDELSARPGWDQITAVQDGNIVVVNADAASRWGPRLPEFVAAVSDAVAGANIGS